MSARIAPEPISAGAGTVADHRSRSALDLAGSEAKPGTAYPRSSAQQPVLSPILAPTPPPGAAFAVALISSQLPPKPRNERELQLRPGSADLPAQGSLALHDRLV